MRTKENLERINERIATAQQRKGVGPVVKIVAITKKQPSNIIAEAYSAGLTIIGENRVQEAETKFAEIPGIASKLTKRLVGHLQSNKINKSLNLFDTVDSVDSLKLADKIGIKALSLNRNIPILLEVNTSGESNKFGFNPRAIDEILACADVHGIELRGLMTIGPLTADTKQIRKAFIELRKLHELIKTQLTKNAEKFTELSMGMSGDFEIAIEEGATMIRLGTILFGARQ